jgi:DNA mismatch repair protein MutS2
LIERGDIEFEDVISAIDEDKKKAEAERMEAAALKLAMEKQQDELQRQAEVFKKQKAKLMADAREEARDMLRDARETADQVQKELKALSKMDSLGARNKGFDRSRRRLKESEGKYAERIIKQVNNNPVSASELSVGDRVKVLSLDQNGEILTLPDDKGDLTVQVGIMKASVNLDDLVLIKDTISFRFSKRQRR